MDNKAVILGNNYYIGLSTIRCLGSMGIHTVAVDYSNKGNYGAASKYCRERQIAPHYKEDPVGFIRFLQDYARKQSAPPVLIPCHDNYVEILDQYRHELQDYYLFPHMEQGLLTKLMHKEHLHQIAAAHNVLVPETVRVEEDDYVAKVAATIGYPCVVKPVDSPAFMAMFRKKLFIVDNESQLLQAVDKAQAAGFEVIVQRIIPGFDDHMYTFDAYLNAEGKVTHWATFQKYRQYPINFGASVYTVHRHVPELYDIGAPFLEALGFHGFVEIEFKKDADTGNYYLIELNVRITNFNTLLHKIGLNMPYITYRELTGDPVPPHAVTTDTNTAFWYGYEDMFAIKDYVRTKQLTIGQVVRTLTKKKANAIWSWKDPKPFFVFWGMIFARVLAKFRKA